MKKLLLSVLAICIAIAASAQFKGGIKAGINMLSQKYSVPGESETYNGTSFHAGLYGNYAFSDAFSIQPELLYNSLKADVEDEDLTSNYLSIPVMFVYGFADNMFNVQAGPQIGFLLSTDPSEAKDEDYMTGTDFTLNLGAGANFKKFNITVRYGIGLSNISGDLWKEILSTDEMDIKNNVFQVSLGYQLFGE